MDGQKCAERMTSRLAEGSLEHIPELKLHHMGRPESALWLSNQQWMVHQRGDHLRDLLQFMTAAAIGVRQLLRVGSNLRNGGAIQKQRRIPSSSD